MSLEDRVHASVDEAVRSLVKHVLHEATADRDAAIAEAREHALREAEQAAAARVADADARHRTELNDALAAARADERERSSRDVRSQVDAAAQQRIVEAIASVEGRLGKVLADAHAQAAEEMSRSVAAARAREREIEMAGVSRLLESIRGLDGAASLPEVLDALALASAREAARAAVLVIRGGDRVQGWKLSGFGSRDAQPKSIDLTLPEAGVVGLAVTTQRAVTTRDATTPTAGPGFERLPAEKMGLAVPVVAAGRVVAIVYADGFASDGHERTVPSGWPEVVEVLARHAGRCVEALAAIKTAESPRQKVVA